MVIELSKQYFFRIFGKNLPNLDSGTAKCDDKTKLPFSWNFKLLGTFLENIFVLSLTLVVTMVLINGSQMVLYTMYSYIPL